MSALGAPPSAPVFDTWGPSESAASWCVEPARAGEAPGNAWAAGALAASLACFGGLCRAWRVAVGSTAPGPGASAVLEWSAGEPPDGFVTRVDRAVREFAVPVYSVEADLDLHAWSRLVDSPRRPVRAWLRVSTRLRLWAGEPAPRSACLTMDHTLFRGHSADGRDNRELHRLNQPALEGALRRWEERLGPITEFDGLRGVYRYGFEETTDR